MDCRDLPSIANVEGQSSACISTTAISPADGAQARHMHRVHAANSIGPHYKPKDCAASSSFYTRKHSTEHAAHW
jgi:hypothetical protein